MNLIMKVKLSAKFLLFIHSYANKTNFHMKAFALSLAFIMRFTVTRKWPIAIITNCISLDNKILEF